MKPLAPIQSHYRSTSPRLFSNPEITSVYQQNKQDREQKGNHLEQNCRELGEYRFSTRV
jgi:hypothetical protein